MSLTQKRTCVKDGADETTMDHRRIDQSFYALVERTRYTTTEVSAPPAVAYYAVFSAWRAAAFPVLRE